MEKTPPGIHRLIGRKIKEARRARGLTQDQLAAASGLDTSHLSRIETGKTHASVNALDRISRELGVPIHQFFLGIPVATRKEDPLTYRLAATIRDASPGKRRMMLRVLQSMSRDK